MCSNELRRRYWPLFQSVNSTSVRKHGKAVGRYSWWCWWSHEEMNLRIESVFSAMRIWVRTAFEWKHFFVAQLTFNPPHQEIYVFWCRLFHRRFIILPIFPEILEFWTGAHLWTCTRSTKVANRSINETDLIKKVDRCILLVCVLREFGYAYCLSPAIHGALHFSAAQPQHTCHHSRV